MRKFIINIFKFLLFPTIIIGIIFFTIIKKIGLENLPALNFSSSYSYNEKIRFLKNKSNSPSIIAIGSSMTLNNLDSDIVVKELKDDEYLNVSSWGLRISESYKLLKELYGIYEFNQFISVINIGDFEKGSKKIDYSFLKYYLTNNILKTIYTTIYNFDLDYYYKNIDYVNYTRKCYKDYEYLNYDDFGMVKFNRDGFNINNERWLDNHLDKVLDNSEYLYLDSISNFCLKHNIKYYVFHSPHRDGLIQDLNLFEKKKYHLHLKKIDSIMNNKQHYVNSNRNRWNDTLFVDGIHLDEIGAKLFTQYCFEEIKTRTHNNVYKK